MKNCKGHSLGVWVDAAGIKRCNVCGERMEAGMKLLRTVNVRLDKVTIKGGWRNGLDEDVVKAICATMERGELVPPIILTHDYRLVAGRHRFEAAKLARLKTLRADVFRFASPEDERMQVIRENLHRRQLGKEERDALIRELVGIVTGEVDPQVAEKPPQGGRPKSPQRQAVIKVAEETGLSEDTVQRAVSPPKPKRLTITDDDGAVLVVPEPDLIPGFDMRGATDHPFLSELRAVCARIDEADGHLKSAQAALKRLDGEVGDGEVAAVVAADVERIHREIHALAVQLRAERPKALCVYCRAVEGERENCPACKGAAFLRSLDNVPKDLLRGASAA